MDSPKEEDQSPDGNDQGGGATDDQKEESDVLLQNDGDDWISQYFSMFCANITIPIYLNLIWVLDEGSNGYSKIQQFVISEDRSWIRFDVLCRLFPNVAKVKIGCGGKLVLKQSTFEQFIGFFGENTPENGCNLKAVVIDDADESELKVDSALNEFKEKFKQIGWSLDANKFRTKIFISQNTDSANWDELLSE